MIKTWDRNRLLNGNESLISSWLLNTNHVIAMRCAKKLKMCNVVCYVAKLMKLFRQFSFSRGASPAAWNIGGHLLRRAPNSGNISPRTCFARYGTLASSRIRTNTTGQECILLLIGKFNKNKNQRKIYDAHASKLKNIIFKRRNCWNVEQKNKTLKDVPLTGAPSMISNFVSVSLSGGLLPIKFNKNEKCKTHLENNCAAIWFEFARFWNRFGNTMKLETFIWMKHWQ